METRLRIPEDPEEFDVVPYVLCGKCAVGSFPGTDHCPKRPLRPEDNGFESMTFLCLQSNRPEHLRIMYVPRRLYGNEEDV